MNNIDVQIAKNDIYIIDVLKYFLANKKFISITTFIFAISSIIFSLMITDRYTSSVLLAPSQSQSQLKQFSSMLNQYSGLASSLGGLNLGANTELSSKDIAIKKVNSLSFLSELIENEEILVPLMAAKGWNRNSNALIIDSDIYDESKKLWIRNVSLPFTPKPSPQEAMIPWKKAFEYFEDRRTGFITLQVTHYSPYVAKEWLDKIVLYLNDSMRLRDVEDADNAINYLTQKAYETDQDELRSVYFALIQEQTKKKVLAFTDSEYVFEVIDPAVVSEKKSHPWRALICVLGTVAGLLLSLTYLILRRAYIKHSLNT
tara:strand:- start:1483 stop:2430 length:948 start_codon:yes stop_codon:yes gene_type:complete